MSPSRCFPVLPSRFQLGVFLPDMTQTGPDLSLFPFKNPPPFRPVVHWSSRALRRSRSFTLALGVDSNGYRSGTINGSSLIRGRMVSLLCEGADFLRRWSFPLS